GGGRPEVEEGGLMARSRVLAMAAILAFRGGLALAQEAPTADMLRVLGPVEDGPRITPYLRAQLDRAWRQDDERRATFERVRSEAELLVLRARIRARVLEIIGGLPSAKTPLNARVVGTVPMDGYRIEKVIFESLPGLQVTALVYVPEGPPERKPAVLVPCGHSPDGKAFKNYQEL